MKSPPGLNACCHNMSISSESGLYLISRDEPGGANIVALKAPVLSAVVVITFRELILMIATDTFPGTEPGAPERGTANISPIWNIRNAGKLCRGIARGDGRRVERQLL